MKRFASRAALALIIFALTAQAAAAKDTWTSVRSKNFFLVGNASEKDIRQVATRLEQFRYVFSQLFPNAKLAAPVPTTVVVFKSDSSYTPFKPLYNGKPANVAGYFQPGPDVNYVTLTAEKREESPYAVIFHEYSHLIVNSTLGDPPVWFNEGLAEYYSTFAVSDGDRKITIGAPVSNHVYLLRERFMPLETLLRVTHDDPAYNERDKQGIFYAESWAFVHYLLQGNQGQRVKQLARFSDLLSAGKPLAESFQEAFQSDFKTMEKELRNYVQKNSYRAQVFSTDKPLVFDSEMTAAPLSDAEAQAYLGDLLLHTNRLDAAEKQLSAALAAGDTPQAHASLGMLRVRQGRFTDAVEELRKAVEGNSQNYLAHYYYAFAVQRQTVADGQLVTSFPADDARVMRAELKRAIELNPAFAESYYQLAFVSLVMHGDMDEAAKLVNKARALEPARQSFPLLLAQIEMRKENFPAARRLLEPVTRSANASAGERAQAQSLLAAISSMEESRARYERERTEAETERASSAGPPRLQRRSDSQQADQQQAGPALDNVKPMIKRRKDGDQLRGTLTRIDCQPGAGAIFNVKVGERVLRLRAASMERVEFVSYDPGLAGAQLGCGVRKPENLVFVTFRRATDPRSKFDGELLAVDFVTPDIELEPEGKP